MGGICWHREVVLRVKKFPPTRPIQEGEERLSMSPVSCHTKVEPFGKWRTCANAIRRSHCSRLCCGETRCTWNCKQSHLLLYLCSRAPLRRRRLFRMNGAQRVSMLTRKRAPPCIHILLLTISTVYPRAILQLRYVYCLWCVNVVRSH